MRLDEQIDDEFHSYLTIVAVFTLGKHFAMADDVVSDVTGAIRAAQHGDTDPEIMRVYFIQSVESRSRVVKRGITFRGSDS